MVERLSNAALLLTARLDSDDALATGIWPPFQREFAHQDRLFVDFPAGADRPLGR